MMTDKNEMKYLFSSTNCIIRLVWVSFFVDPFLVLFLGYSWDVLVLIRTIILVRRFSTGIEDARLCPLKDCK